MNSSDLISRLRVQPTASHFLKPAHLYQDLIAEREEAASHIEAQDKLLAEFKSNHLVVTNSMISAAIGRAEELGFSMEDWQANSIILAALSQKDTP